MLLPLETHTNFKVQFTVCGEPVPKGRARFTKQGFSYTPSHTRKYENLVRLAAQDAMDGRIPIATACEIEVYAYMPIPQSWSQKKKQLALQDAIRPITKPDGDNFLKSASDACNGVVFVDDNLITDWIIHKRYSDRPRLEIEVRA